MHEGGKTLNRNLHRIFHSYIQDTIDSSECPVFFDAVAWGERIKKLTESVIEFGAKEEDSEKRRKQREDRREQRMRHMEKNMQELKRKVDAWKREEEKTVEKAEEDKVG